MAKIKIIPEINLLIQNHRRNSPVYQKFLKQPIELDSGHWENNPSVLNLLLSYNFNFESVGIYYRKGSIGKITDTGILNRHNATITRSTIYVFDTLAEIESVGGDADVIEDYTFPYADNHSGSDNLYDANSPLVENIFKITYLEKDLLDIIIQLKAGQNITFPGDFVYAELATDLEKLMFRYLDYEKNSDTTYMNSDVPITSTSSRLISVLFEKWLIDLFYMHKSLKGTAGYDSLVTPAHDNLYYKITSQDIIDKYIALDQEKTPISKSSIKIIHNNKHLVEGKDFNYLLVSDIPTIDWDGTSFENSVSEDDIIYLSWAYTT